MCVILNLLTTTKATPTYTASHCTNTTSYIKNPPSTFQTNLKALLFSLSNSSSPEFTTIAGFGTIDAVNGHIMCRGDVTDTICDECVTAATKEIIIRCPDQKEALIWYDECFLRYTNRYFAFDNIIPRANLDDGNISTSVDLRTFNWSLDGFLDDLVINTLSSSQSKTFASGEVAVTELTRIYGLVQCMDDLTRRQCETCLGNAIGTLPYGKQGARALL
ncbi:cysteine-rich receptor protein kinase [Trifolium repens]|nr:cysteine-rich receptor protein kinase [Trifolium repens]